MLNVQLSVDTARAVRAFLEDGRHIRPIAEAIKALDAAVAESLKRELTEEEIESVGGGAGIHCVGIRPSIYCERYLKNRWLLTMTIKFKKGDAVRQVTPAPLEGTIVQSAIVDDEIKFLVQMPDDSQHWFREEEIELREERTE